MDPYTYLAIFIVTDEANGKSNTKLQSITQLEIVCAPYTCNRRQSGFKVHMT